MTAVDAIGIAVLFGLAYLFFIRWEVHRWITFIFIALPLIWWFWNGPKTREQEEEA